jgi:hypothetical protein
MADANAKTPAPAPSTTGKYNSIAMVQIAKIKAHHIVGSLAERKRAERIDKLAAEIATNKSTPEW